MPLRVNFARSCVLSLRMPVLTLGLLIIINPNLPISVLKYVQYGQITFILACIWGSDLDIRAYYTGRTRRYRRSDPYQ